MQEVKKLKYTTKVINFVDYDDLEKFIKASFGQKAYSIVADEEASNGSYLMYNVEPEEIDILELLEFIEKNKGSYVTSKLLNDLCFDGKLEQGEYCVHICY